MFQNFLHAIYGLTSGRKKRNIPCLYFRTDQKTYTFKVNKMYLLKVINRIFQFSAATRTYIFLPQPRYVFSAQLNTFTFTA